MQSSQSPLTEPRQAGAQRSCGLTIHTCFSPTRPSLDHIIPQPSLNAHLGLEALHPQSVLRYQSSLAFRFAFNMHTFESALPSNQCEPSDESTRRVTGRGRTGGFEVVPADALLTSMGRNSTLHPISEFGGGGLNLIVCQFVD